ncbi:MAG: TetR family transcriptional regulator C-terminal domain-containing protein, partial [Streptosporangiaceae bacterium]
PRRCQDPYRPTRPGTPASQRQTDPVNLSSDRLAAQTRMNEAHYFRGRDELVAAAVGLRCAQVLAGLTQALGGVASLAELEQALAGFVAGFEQMGLPGCPIGSLATEVAGRNEGARLQAASAFDAWEQLFADALGRMRERGELRPDAAPDVLATALLASIEGGMVLSQARKNPASLRIAVQAGLAQVRAFLS